MMLTLLVLICLKENLLMYLLSKNIIDILSRFLPILWKIHCIFACSLALACGGNLLILYGISFRRLRISRIYLCGFHAKCKRILYLLIDFKLRTYNISLNNNRQLLHWDLSIFLNHQGLPNNKALNILSLTACLDI